MKIVAGPYGYRGLILKTRKIRHFGKKNQDLCLTADLAQSGTLC